MHIISLHDLCRQELIHLLNARFMPTGWTRNGDRKAQQLHSKAQRWLANAFAGVPDALVARPNSRVCSQLHATAIAEHKLERMVYRMVELFAALPVPDQSEAFATAELTDRLCQLQRFQSDLERMRKHLDKDALPAATADLPLAPLREALEDTLRAVRQRVFDTEGVLQTSRQAMST